MDGLIQKYAKGVHHLKSISISIFLSVLTTLIGLGILIFSKHPAMFSIALISIIGILCVWIISQTLQPLLFKILITNRTKNKLHPLSFFKLIKTFIAFAYFVFGALLLVIIGFILTKLIPIEKKKLKYLYHYILCNFTKSLIYLMANVKKKIINPLNENHKSPSIIIANHQSFLDILSLVMLHPKFILLTNHWVWNSPIFGLVVQMADYLKAQDAEINIPFLKEKIKEGYSIVIFPEGTRSFDGQMKRFHKGAFLLAEQLDVDILPIVLHGTGYCMSKGDFLLKNGQITIEYLPRILITNMEFGITYQEKTKNISKYFKQKYLDLAAQIEDVNYFHDQLIGNYILKGPVLEWYMRIKLKLEKNYKFMDEIIPLKNNILDIGCGYGFLDYFLAFRSSHRSISALDFDVEKISIASNGYLRPSNLTFETANILEYQMKCYDTIIISDVLHYLNDHQQNEILKSCIKALNPNGQLIIRDGIKEKKNRHKGTQFSEFLSTKVFNFNKVSESGLSFISSNLIYTFVKNNNLSIAEVDSTKLTSNITFILKKS
jgi:1-acyl-sn-glycerol-3-phosphate acyltransferase